MSEENVALKARESQKEDSVKVPGCTSDACLINRERVCQKDYSLHCIRTFGFWRKMMCGIPEIYNECLCMDTARNWKLEDFF